MITPETEQDLIKNIVARSTDDGPRLAYAEWLEAHGQEPRARLIRVQCQQEQLRAEERTLLDAHAEEWGRPLRDLGATRWAFHRGFPEEIDIPLADYLDRHERLDELTPVTRVRLSGADDALLGQLAALPALREFRALEIGRDEGGFGAAGIRALVRSPHLTGLRELGLHSRAIGTDGVRHLTGALVLKNLTKLELNDPRLADAENAFSDIVRALDPDAIQELKWSGQTFGSDSLVFKLARSDAKRGGGPTP